MVGTGSDFRNVGAVDAGENLGECAQQLGLECRVAGHNGIAIHAVSLAFHIADSRRRPPETISFPAATSHECKLNSQKHPAPTGDIGQIQSGRAGPADAVGPHADLMIEMNIDIFAPLTARKSSGGQGLLQTDCF